MGGLGLCPEDTEGGSGLLALRPTFQLQVEGVSDAHSYKLLTQTRSFHPWGHKVREHGRETEPEGRGRLASLGPPAHSGSGTGGAEAPEGWELTAKGPKACRVSDRGSRRRPDCRRERGRGTEVRDQTWGRPRPQPLTCEQGERPPPSKGSRAAGRRGERTCYGVPGLHL